uniref:Glucan biosynthesis protein n=1 Tax=Bosea sp. NBC_00436 TaxID=2969620 RepID=A0A9E8CU97_9HYPH
MLSEGVHSLVDTGNSALLLSGLNPRGFRLMQRDRDFGSYQDLEAHYDARPGYWVQPQGAWGEGRIDLIEIPTVNEAFDNIVACWAPKTPLPIGQAAEFSYRIAALSTTWHLHPYAQVQQSFNGSDIEDGVAKGKGTKRFIVDFAGGDLAYYQSEPVRLELVARTTAGAITTKILTFNAPLKGVRAIVDSMLPDGQSTELRMFLRARNRALSETWTATWSVPAGDAPPAANVEELGSPRGRPAVDRFMPASRMKGTIDARD